MNANEIVSLYTDTKKCAITLHPAAKAALEKERPSNNARKGQMQTVYPIKTSEEIEAIAKWLYDNRGAKYLLAFTLGVNLGLRANELLALRMQDVFFPNGSVRFIEDLEDTTDGVDIFQSKTHKHRTVYLNHACKQALEWYKEKEYIDEYLFPSREGGHVTVDAFRKVLKDAAKACGVKQNIGTHTCRKTWGWHQYKYNCSAASLDISMLQRAFGHSSEEVTLRYLGITDEEDKSLYRNMNIFTLKAIDNRDG